MISHSMIATPHVNLVTRVARGLPHSLAPSLQRLHTGNFTWRAVKQIQK